VFNVATIAEADLLLATTAGCAVRRAGGAVYLLYGSAHYSKYGSAHRMSLD